MNIVKNLPFFNVVADGVATIELPKGMTYHSILLKLGGTTFAKSNIARIVGKINGKIFYDITGSRLDKLNSYRGLASASNFLKIDFTDKSAKTLGGQVMGAIGTAEGVSSFTLEITISGASAPTLESWSMVSAPMALGPILAMVHHPVTFSAGGKYPIVLPHGPESDHLIKRVHFFHTNMTELEVKKNGLIIFEGMETAVNEHFQKDYDFTPQTGLYTYDPVVTHNMRDNVPLGNARSLQFNTTVSASDTVDVYAEYIANLAKL